MEINCVTKKLEQTFKVDSEYIISNLCGKLENSQSNYIKHAIYIAILTYFLKIIFTIFIEKKEIIGDISAIQSDVSSMTEILHEMKIIDGFINAYQNPNKYEKLLWVDGPRKENYYSLYEALAPRIGRMPKNLPNEIVKFYTFSKASRDAAHPFSKKNEEDNKLLPNQVKESAMYVLLATKNSLEAAKSILEYESSYWLKKKKTRKNKIEKVNELLNSINASIMR